MHRTTIAALVQELSGVMGGALALGVFSIGNANAASFIPCSAIDPSIVNNVTGAIGCQVSSVTDANEVAPLTVNDPPGFFNFTDWKFVNRTDIPTNEITQTWDLTPTLSGISNLKNLMLVFDAVENNTPLVGYLIADGVTFGTWISPFTSLISPTTPNQTASYGVSFYYRDDVGTVSTPEPNVWFSLVMIGAVGILLPGIKKRR